MVMITTLYQITTKDKPKHTDSDEGDYQVSYTGLTSSHKYFSTSDSDLF